MFRIYQRTSKNTGISMPLWVALPVYMLVGGAILAVTIFGLIAAALVLKARDLGYFKIISSQPSQPLGHLLPHRTTPVGDPACRSRVLAPRQFAVPYEQPRIPVSDDRRTGRSLFHLRAL